MNLDQINDGDSSHYPTSPLSCFFFFWFSFHLIPLLTDFLFLRNYEQLGLKFKLFSAEVLFNKGLSLIYMGNVQEGLADMEDARREKATDEHGVIDDAIQDRGEGYTVFSIVRFMPSSLTRRSY